MLYYSIYLLHLSLLHALHSTLTCISIHSSVAAVRFTSAPRALSVRFTILFIYPHICHILDLFIYFFNILTITSFYYQYVLPVYCTYLSLYVYIIYDSCTREQMTCHSATSYPPSSLPSTVSSVHILSYLFLNINDIHTTNNVAQYSYTLICTHYRIHVESSGSSSIFLILLTVSCSFSCHALTHSSLLMLISPFYLFFLPCLQYIASVSCFLFV